MDNKGQSILSEYVMIFFIVIAAGVAMTTFVQRGLEGRVHDARNMLINATRNACDANCMTATGGSIRSEYEPYYEQYLGLVQNYEDTTRGTTTGNPKVIGAEYLKSVNGEASNMSTSIQLPPICSQPHPPSCCKDGTGCVCQCLAGHVCGKDTCGNPNGCGVCPNGQGCNAQGQCFECTCPTFNPGGFCSSYTANCGPDTCGHPDVCGTCGGFGSGSYCFIGRCWVPIGGGGSNCANCAHPCF